MSSSLKPSKCVTYTPDLADRVCELLLEGLSLRKIEKVPDMPSKRTILNWLLDHEEFRRKYELARMMMVEDWAYDIIEIADDASNDWIITESGERIFNSNHVTRDRERINTRKWLMSKWMPQRYGDRVTADITVRGDVKELSTEELLAIAGSGGDADLAGGNTAEGGVERDTTVH